MTDHNLGEDAYEAYLANVTPGSSGPTPWRDLIPSQRQVWEKVVAAVVLRLLLKNLAEHHGPLPSPSFDLPEDTVSPLMDEIERKTGKKRDVPQCCNVGCLAPADFEVEDQGEERPDMRLTYSCELHLGAMVSSVPPTKPGGPWIVRCIAAGLGRPPPLPVADASSEVARLRAVVNEVHAWAVCGAIAPPTDMMQNLERIVEITSLPDQVPSRPAQVGAVSTIDERLATHARARS